MYQQYPYGQQYYPNYGQNNYNYNSLGQRQPQMQANQVQNNTTQYEQPIQNIRFLTEDEIKAYIVMPGTKELLIDRVNGVAYIKSANTMGESFSRAFKFDELPNGQAPQKKPEIDTSMFVRVDSLADIIHEELKGFVTIDAIKDINSKIDKLQKQVRINDILKGENKDGE